MANRPWLDEVRKRLANDGLPAAYIRRFMDELSDHFQDLTEETMSTEANAWSRLGEPGQVAQAAVESYRRRSLLGRHPTAAFFVFAISPVVSSIAGLVALLWAGCVIVDQFCPTFFDGPPKWLDTALPDLLRITTIVVPSALASVLYCRLAGRFGLSMKWGFVSCVMIAALAATLTYSVEHSDVPGQSGLRFGMGLPYPVSELGQFLMFVFSSIKQMAQLLVPLAVGCWFLWRKRAEGRGRVGQALRA
jgi:hypothetical protein